MSAPSTDPLPLAYWQQWTASLVSNLGDGVSFVAMPLLALTLTSDERLLSLVTLTTFVPWILLALPVGVFVDRLDRQHLMVAANLVRIGIFLAVAIGAEQDWLSMWSLVGLLTIVGSCEVVFDSSAQAFLPLLVEPSDLPRANGLLFAAEVVAGSLVGLSVGAILFDVSVGLPFSTNAVSFAVAAMLIIAIRPGHRPLSSAAPLLDTGLRAGLRWLAHHSLLRTLAAMFTITNLGLMFGQGVFVKYAVVELGLDATGFGLLLAVTAAGAATGGLIGSDVVARFGIRAGVVGPYLVFGVAHLVIGLAPAAWLVAAAGFVLGAAITVWNVVTVSIRQQVIPPDRFGRVNGVYRWLGAVASAVGVATGGFVAYGTDLRTPFLAGGALALVAAALFARPVLAALPDNG